MKPPNVWRIFLVIFFKHRGTEPRRVYFKFSEDTENLKTPWLCVFI